MGKVNACERHARIRLKIRKKGIFFTLIAITLMTVFILVFTPKADVSLERDIESTRARISSINNYVDDLENRYFETMLRAVTYKTVFSLTYYIHMTGSYIKNLDAAFYEVILNGTIDNVPIDSITGMKIMENNTLTNWSKKIIETAKDTLNVDTAISINSVSVFQTGPWNIDSGMNVNFTVKSNVAEWEKNVMITTTISIEGMLDPYYLENTDNTYFNRIKKSTIEFDEWNITYVREHLRNGTYVHWQNSDAPSFLMRFTNTTTNSSCCGIESLVNPNKLILGPKDQKESYVDYLFWTHKYKDDCTQLYNITGLWNEFRYFKLDFEHVERYNITAQDAKLTC